MGDITPLLSTFEEVVQGLRSSSYKQIPFSLLYDDKGSKLYEQIVKLEEYYPYAAESHFLQEHAPRMARSIPPDYAIIELGCGTATKTAYLLNALRSLYGRYASILA